MGADLTDRIIYLRSIPVAAELPPRVLHVIAGSMRVREFERGEALMREGDPIDSLYLLTEGKVTIERSGRIMGSLVPPQSLGFLGILARAEGTYDAVADVPTRTLDLDADAMLELIEDQRPFLQATLRYVANRMYQETKELPVDALVISPETLPFSLGERPLDLVERILFLRTLRVFRKTNLSGLATISKSMKEVRIAAGQKLWSVGDASSTSFMIVAGEVECAAPDGRVFRYGAATVAGGVDGLAAEPRWYDAATATDVVAFEIRADDFKVLLEDDFAMAMDFIGMLSMGLIQILDRKAALGMNPLAVQRDVAKLGKVPVGV